MDFRSVLFRHLLLLACDCFFVFGLVCDWGPVLNNWLTVWLVGGLLSDWVAGWLGVCVCAWYSLFLYMRFV